MNIKSYTYAFHTFNFFSVDAEDAEAAKDIRTRKLERPGKKRHSSVADTNITAKKQQLQIELMEIDKRTKAI